MTAVKYRHKLSNIQFNFTYVASVSVKMRLQEKLAQAHRGGPPGDGRRSKGGGEGEVSTKREEQVRNQNEGRLFDFPDPPEVY